jgi:hypothetical protein
VSPCVLTAPLSGGGGGGGVTPDFFVDWRTATGTGGTAVSDGGKLGTRSWNGVDPYCNVISASGLGFPSGMTNVMRVTFNNAEGDAQWQGSAFPEISVGQTRWFRVYMRADYPNGAGIGSGFHPYQAALNVAWEFKPISPGASTFRFSFQPRGVAESFDWMAAPLRTTLRIDHSMERISSTQVRFAAINVYDVAGTLLADATDFLESTTGPDTLASVQPVVTLSDLTQDLRGILIGNNGPFGNTYVGGALDWGGFATAIGGTPGPYNASTG